MTKIIMLLLRSEAVWGLLLVSTPLKRDGGPTPGVPRILTTISARAHLSQQHGGRKTRRPANWEKRTKNAEEALGTPEEAEMMQPETHEATASEVCGRGTFSILADRGPASPESL